MKNLFTRVRQWLSPPPAEVVPDIQPVLRVPLTLRRMLASATRPREGRPEPLALLRVRYVGENERNIAVAVGVLAFPDSAYRGAHDAAAAFDTQWVIKMANSELAVNVGIVLVHSHGGAAEPRFSAIDSRTNRELMARLSIGIDTAPYGAMVLSNTSQYAVLAVAGVLRVANVEIVYDTELKGWIA